MRFATVAFSAALLVGYGANHGPAAPAAAQPPFKNSREASQDAASGIDTRKTLAEARRGFVTHPVPNQPRADAPPQPPRGVFNLVKDDSALGRLSAYLTPDPRDGKKHPAIIWITGGDSNTIDDVWTEAPRENDQTAAAYRKAGIVMMFPSLRGGNDNPGVREGFLGEVDDILAAADFLARQRYVDPKRIYLGGHSTGGTLALLTAEYSSRFRAVFAFGPAADVRSYAPEYTPFDRNKEDEVVLRAPFLWLHSVKATTFVIEGTVESNLAALDAMARASTNPMIHFLRVEGTDHFSLLAPVNERIAAKILADTGPTSNITITDRELSAR
jgi:alpha/beta superfamily hydrolase